MAEVKLSVTGKDVITYTDNAALITASIAPPSMTFVDQNPQVTMAKDPVVILTYKQNSEIEISSTLKRNVKMDVEIESQLKRTVDSDDPFKVVLKGDLIRNITNSVELDAQLSRTVLSFNVGLEYGLRRTITKTLDIEGNLTRNVIGPVAIEGRLTRIVLSDDDQETGIPEKTYESFIDKNKLFRVQHDVLDEDVSDNPYFDKQISNLQNAALLTKNQTIIKAINELFVNQRAIFETTFNAFQKFDHKLGDLVSDRGLNEKYKALGFDNIIHAIIELSDNINGIIDFIGSQTHDLEEMGYKDLVDGLQQLNDKIRAITFEYDDITQEQVEWIFKATTYIPDIKDTVFSILDAMDDEIKTFEQKVTDKFIDFKRDADSYIHACYLNILNDFDNTTEEEIRDIFYNHLESQEDISESEDQLVKMLIDLGYQIADHKDEVRRQITALSDEMHDYIEMTENDIRRIFTEIDEASGEEIVLWEDQIVEELNAIKESLNNLEVLHTTDIDSIKADLITNIGSIRNDLTANITSMNTTINNTKRELESSIEELELKHDADIQTVTDSINSTKTELEELRALDLENIRSEIDTKITEVNTKHESDITKIENTIEALELKHDTDIAGLSSIHELDINNLRQEISNLTNTHNLDMETAQENLRLAKEELLNLYNTVSSKLEELRTTVNTNQDNNNDRFNAAESRITALEEYKTNLSNNLDSLAKAIVKAFREYVSIDETEIRDILDEFETNIMDEDIAQRTYEELVQYIKNEFITIKNALSELDKRVTILEIRTDPYIVDDSDIYAMFPELDYSDIAPDFDIDNYPVATEEQIESLFNGGSSAPVTVESSIASEGDIFDMFGVDPDQQKLDDIQDILNNIATEEDILSLFGLTETQYQTMEELLEAIKAKNAETDIIAEEASEQDIMDMFQDPNG